VLKNQRVASATNEDVSRRRGRPVAATKVIMTLMVFALSGLLAACGGGFASPGVAGLGSTTTTAPTTPSPAGNSGSSTANALAYARCMRSHGISDFPDPNAQGGFSATAGMTPTSPQYLTAQRRCQPLVGSGLPPEKQAQVEAKQLEFAQCMRTHGVPNYPDPTFGANGSVSEKVSASRLNAASPRFQAAQRSCQHHPTGGGS
jgi:hypothetical protein